MGQVFMPPSSAPILFLFFSWFSPGAHYKATDFQGPGSVLVRFKAVSAFGCFSSQFRQEPALLGNCGRISPACGSCAYTVKLEVIYNNHGI